MILAWASHFKLVTSINYKVPNLSAECNTPPADHYHNLIKVTSSPPDQVSTIRLIREWVMVMGRNIYLYRTFDRRAPLEHERYTQLRYFCYLKWLSHHSTFNTNSFHRF